VSGVRDTRTTRRGFVVALPIAALAAARLAGAQEPEVAGGSMAGDGYIPVTRPAKPGATPLLTPLERDAVERKLSCPCPCTLDVFTCRTSMPCGFSPRMHQDVVRLVEGGYSGEEIVAAFRASYGEKVLMAPEAKGFNLLGYLMPFLAIGTGGVALAVFLQRWRARGPTPGDVALATQSGGTPDEMARLEAAVRDEDDA
jgi:cytochrome c-type biogenesis protein CcmH